LKIMKRKQYKSKLYNDLVLEIILFQPKTSTITHDSRIQYLSTCIAKFHKVNNDGKFNKMLIVCFIYNVHIVLIKYLGYNIL
jgi:hypothetical protein